MSLNPTKGTWEAKGSEFNQTVWVECNGKRIVNIKQSEHDWDDTQLIADAGTTYNNCSVLPSELLKQRDELLEALKICYNSLATYGSHPIIEKQVKNAIKKATK